MSQQQKRSNNHLQLTYTNLLAVQSIYSVHCCVFSIRKTVYMCGDLSYMCIVVISNILRDDDDEIFFINRFTK